MKLRFHRKLIKQIKATEETFGLTEDEIDLFINRVDNDGEGSEESSGSEGEKEEEEREMDNIKSLVEVDEDDLEEDNSDGEEEEEEVDQIPSARLLVNFQAELLLDCAELTLLLSDPIKIPKRVDL